jgi:hypothetical protein
MFMISRRVPRPQKKVDLTIVPPSGVFSEIGSSLFKPSFEQNDCAETKMVKRKTPPEPTAILDRFLLSDRAPPDSMGLSDLDGFLTGIVIGPELIMPSEWMPVIWGGDSPKFKNTGEASRVLSALME